MPLHIVWLGQQRASAPGAEQVQPPMPYLLLGVPSTFGPSPAWPPPAGTPAATQLVHEPAAVRQDVTDAAYLAALPVDASATAAPATTAGVQLVASAAQQTAAGTGGVDTASMLPAAMPAASGIAAAAADEQEQQDAVCPAQHAAAGDSEGGSEGPEGAAAGPAVTTTQTKDPTYDVADQAAGTPGSGHSRLKASVLLRAAPVCLSQAAILGHTKDPLLQALLLEQPQLLRAVQDRVLQQVCTQQQDASADSAGPGGTQASSHVYASFHDAARGQPGMDMICWDHLHINSLRNSTAGSGGSRQMRLDVEGEAGAADAAAEDGSDVEEVEEELISSLELARQVCGWAVPGSRVMDGVSELSMFCAGMLPRCCLLPLAGADVWPKSRTCVTVHFVMLC